MIALLVAPGAIRENPVAWGILARYAGWVAGLGLLWLLMAHAFRAYEGEIRASIPATVRQVTKAGLVAGGLFLAIAAGLGDMALEESAVAAGIFLALVVILPAGGRLLYRAILGRPSRLRPTLVAGTGEAAREVADALRARGGDTYRLVGFVASGPAGSGSADGGPESAAEQRPVVGTVDELPELIRRHDAATVVDALPPESGDLDRVVDRCLETGAQVELMPLLYERLTGRVPVARLEGAWASALPLEHSSGRAIDRASKRFMDVVLTALGVLVMLPVFPLIAAAIYLESPGPIFYSQERLGRGGEVITVLKFRSMVPDAEAAGSPVWAREGDERITRVGRMLRATHVDEFPQFVNILKGEMSVIGPRPERPPFVAELEREIPHYRARHALKPGLGGWGLVNQGYGSSREEARVKHEYDLYYLRHQSLWLDLVILARTFVDTLTLRGT